jgi:hypothetical protein
MIRQILSTTETIYEAIIQPNLAILLLNGFFKLLHVMKSYIRCLLQAAAEQGPAFPYNFSLKSQFEDRLHSEIGEACATWEIRWITARFWSKTARIQATCATPVFEWKNELTVERKSQDCSIKL